MHCRLNTLVSTTIECFAYFPCTWFVNVIAFNRLLVFVSERVGDKLFAGNKVYVS